MTGSDSTAANGSKIAMCTQPKSVRRSFALESTGFAAAELASMGVSLGVVAIAEDLIPQSIMKKATHAVAKVCVEPYLDTIEKAMSECKLKECQVDHTKTREERAERLARGIVVFGAAYLASLGAKLWIRGKMNEHFEVAGASHKPAPNGSNWVKTKIHDMSPNNWSPDTRLIFAADEAVHIGSLVYLNTKASDFTDRNIETMSKALQKMGVSQQRAQDISTMAMVWEVPNFLGLLAGETAIFGKHAYGWPKEHKYQKFADIVSGKAMSSNAHIAHT